jgi:hypothetical protein
MKLYEYIFIGVCDLCAVCSMWCAVCSILIHALCGSAQHQCAALRQCAVAWQCNSVQQCGIVHNFN